jgi:hypothetical protein
MAYMSSTTTAPNVPSLVSQSINAISNASSDKATTNDGPPRLWIYNSTHISSDIAVANFFTDGYALGLRLGDLLWHRDATYVLTSHSVLAVGATTCDVSVGTTIGLGA